MSLGEKTSVKVAQTPGGNSSISLGWSENVVYTAGKIDRNESSIVFNDGPKEPLYDRRNQTTVPGPANYQQPVKLPVGGVSSVCFGGSDAPKQNGKSRVPPGGKSTFAFG